MTRRGPGIAILITILLAACGGSSGANPTAGVGGAGGGATGSKPAASAPGAQAAGGSLSGSLPQACTLLTASDAQTALGVPVGAPTVDQGGGSSDNCTYAPVAITGFTSIELAVFGPASFAHIKQSSAGATVTAISGLGDDALFIDAGSLAGVQLDVLKGNTAFYVAIFDNNESADQIKAAEKAVAEVVLSRL